MWVGARPKVLCSSPRVVLPLVLPGQGRADGGPEHEHHEEDLEDPPPRVLQVFHLGKGACLHVGVVEGFGGKRFALHLRPPATWALSGKSILKNHHFVQTKTLFFG